MTKDAKNSLGAIGLVKEDVEELANASENAAKGETALQQVQQLAETVSVLSGRIDSLVQQFSDHLQNP